MDSHYNKDFDNFFDGSGAKSGEASSSSFFNQGSSFNEARRNSTTITTHANTDTTRHNLLHNIAAATPTPGSTTMNTPTNTTNNSNNNNSNNSNNNNGAGLLGNNTTGFSMDDTPAILLEQLAYIDTFMPQLEEDITSYQVQHSGENHSSSVSGVGVGGGGATAGNGGNNQYAQLNSIQFGNYVPSNTDNNINMFNDQNSIFNIDDRLAAELSVFADETFIFPDEDKHDHENINNNNINALNYNNTSTSSNNNGNQFSPSGNMFNPNSLKENSKNAFNKPSGHLADRRNNMLSKQYDLSRKRISSKHKSQYDNNEHGNSVSSSVGSPAGTPAGTPVGTPVGTPAGSLLNRHDMTTFDSHSDNSNTVSNSNTTTSMDHGGFVNFDVSDRTSRTPPLVPNFNSSLPTVSFPNAATFASSASSAFSLPNAATTTQSDSRELSANDLSAMNLSELLQFMKHPLHGNKHKMYAGLPDDCYTELTESFGFSDAMINALLYLIEYYHSNFLKFDKNHNQDGVSSVLSPGSNLKLDAYKQSLFYKNAHSLAMIIKAGTLQSNPTTIQAAEQQHLVSTNNETDTSNRNNNNNNNSSDVDNSAIDGALREEDQDKSEQPESSAESGQLRETSTDQINAHVTDKPPNDNSENNKTTQSSVPRNSSVVAEVTNGENHSQGETSDADTGDTLTERESSTPPTTTKNKVNKPPNKFKKLEDLEEKVTELLKVSSSLHQKVKTLELENSMLKKLVKDKGEFSSIEEVENLYNGNK